MKLFVDQMVSFNSNVCRLLRNCELYTNMFLNTLPNVCKSDETFPGQVFITGKRKINNTLAASRPNFFPWTFDTSVSVGLPPTAEKTPNICTRLHVHSSNRLKVDTPIKQQ